MFAPWHDFYILIGSAAGALIGLLFIVVTLTAGQEREQAFRGQSRYMTPTVAQFTTVLLVSAIAAAPVDAGLQRAALVALAAGFCIWALVNVWRMFFEPGATAAHWSDPWFYAAAPAAGYMVLAVVSDLGSDLGVGATAVAILVIGIRNAWDLITWIAPKGATYPPPDQTTPPPG